MKNKKIVIILLLILLVVAIGAGAAYYFILRPSQAAAAAEKPAELYEYAISDSFVTNVKDSNKLLKTTIVLVVNEKDLNDFLDANKYTIRDTILFILRGLTEDDIKKDDIQDTLRQSIPEALNEALEIDSIVSIYFSDFVMQ